MSVNPSIFWEVWNRNFPVREVWYPQFLCFFEVSQCGKFGPKFFFFKLSVFFLKLPGYFLNYFLTKLRSLSHFVFGKRFTHQFPDFSTRIGEKIPHILFVIQFPADFFVWEGEDKRHAMYQKGSYKFVYQMCPEV